MGKSKHKSPDYSRHPSGGGERNKDEIIRSLTTHLELLKLIVKSRKYREPWDLFDRRQHQKRNTYGTWTQHKPKQYWHWRHRVAPYKQPMGHYTASQLIQPLVKCIINVQTTQQEQQPGNIQPII